MTLKKTFASAVLLIAAVVLSGCAGFTPTLPGTPPVEVEHGVVAVSVDLTNLVAEADVESVVVTLVGQGQPLVETVPVAGDVAEAEIVGVAVGEWEATVVLRGADGEELAATTQTINVAKAATAAVALTARVEAGVVTLEPTEVGAPGEPGTGHPGTDEPGVGDPGTGDPGYGEPGDEEPGDEPGDDPGVDEPGDDEPGQGEPGDSPAPGDDPAPQPPGVTREVHYIQSGSRTATRTEVYVVRAQEPGPTVMLVGGVHGSERSGWMVAGEVAREWEIDRGTLVVIPEANKDAVRRTRRTGTDGRDLNRAFPRGRALNQSGDWLLAQEIWNVVLDYEPQALLDLHEGWGLREANDRFPGGTLSVGQTLIVYPAGDAEQFADHVLNVLNTEHNPFYGRNGLTYNFQKIGPPVDGSLARKAGNDLGIPAFIAEPTQGRAERHQTTLAQRQDWHRVIVEEYLRWYGLLD